MIFTALAVMAALTYVFYPQYQAQVQLESYAPSQSAIKISEDVKVKHRSNKSGSWSEHIPCLTLQISNAAVPLTACKVTGFIDSPEAARQFLATNYASATGFTVYVSPDKTNVSLDSFSPERARAALLPLALIWAIVPAVYVGLWFFLRRMVRRK